MMLNTIGSYTFVYNIVCWRIYMEVRDILKIAYENVPYYNNLFNEYNVDIETNDLSKIPFTTKDAIRKYGILNFLNKKHLDDEYNILDKDNIVFTTSSGTTGEPMDVLWLKKDYLSSILFHWIYRLKKFYVTPEDIFFSSQRFKNNKNAIIEKSKSEYAINTDCISEELLNNIFIALNEKKPKWLMIQPSILYLLAEYSLKNNITFPDSIKYIEYFSETLLPFYRNKIEAVIKCPTSNMYGCSEINGIAYECENKNLHIIDKNVLVEIIKKNKSIKNNSIGNVCVTSLHNSVMPIIRYRLNDKATISSKKCSCGKTTPIINLINTRMPEFVVFDDLSICSLGKIYFPINRLDFIKIQSNDIIFYLRRFSVEEYNIIFDISTCSDMLRWSVTKAFKNIMNLYGIKCKFHFDFASKIDKNLPQGIMRFQP